jgi:hypothetical protein
MKSFAKYFSDLKTLMNNIDNIVNTEGDDELHDKSRKLQWNIQTHENLSSQKW